MTKKKKYGLFLSVGLLILAIGIRAIILNSLKIGEPIYYRYWVQHYLPTISDSLTATSTMELICVQDSRDRREIKDVHFMDTPEIKVIVVGKQEDKFGIYKVVDHTIYMEWNNDGENGLDSSNIDSNHVDVKSIEVTYSDGTSQVAEIGDICIYGGKSDDTILDATDCMPLYESERMQEYQTKKKIRMEGLTEESKRFLGKTEIIKQYSLKVDGDEITDKQIEINKGQKIRFELSLNGIDVTKFSGIGFDYDYFQIVPELVYSDEAGNRYTKDIYSFPVWNGFRNYKEVRSYVKERKQGF